MIRAIALLALLVPLALAMPAEAQASTYVHVITAPEFQYRTDEDVRVRFQAQLVQGNVPTDEPVRIRVTDRTGTAFPVQQEAYLSGGVAPYPSINHLVFGRLDAGLYELTVHATAGGQSKTHGLSFSVVLPPLRYDADLVATGDGGADFIIRPRDPGTYTVTVYQDGPGGRVRLDTHTLEGPGDNATRIQVPYVQGSATKVEVEDPHGWFNYDNQYRDPVTGARTYGPWVWNPEYYQIDQVQDAQPQRLIVAGILIGLATVATILFLRRR